MKKLYLFLIILGCQQSQGTPEDFFDDGQDKTQNLFVLDEVQDKEKSRFLTDITSFHQKLNTAPPEVGGTSITALYNEFMELYHNEYIPQAWWEEANALYEDTYPFSSNILKDQLTARLFFPVHALALHLKRTHLALLSTYNNLYRLTYAAKHGHIFSLYLLTRCLYARFHTEISEKPKNRPPEILSLFTMVMDQLNTIHETEASYAYMVLIKGELYEYYYDIFKHHALSLKPQKNEYEFVFASKQARSCYASHSSYLTQFTAFTYKKSISRIKREDYLRFAPHLPFLYEDVLRLTPPDQKEDQLQEAIENGYIPPFYASFNQRIQAIEDSLGFKLLSYDNSLVCDPLYSPLETRLKAEANLIELGQEGCPEAWGLLSNLYMSLIINIPNHPDISNPQALREHYRQKLKASIQEGLCMNDQNTYFFTLRLKYSHHCHLNVTTIKDTIESIYSILKK